MAAGIALAAGPPPSVLSRENIERAYGVAPVIIGVEALAAPVVLPPADES